MKCLIFGKNTRFKIRSVLAIVALALLAGERYITSISRMDNLLVQDQRFALALPRRTGKKSQLSCMLECVLRGAHSTRFGAPCAQPEPLARAPRRHLARSPRLGHEVFPRSSRRAKSSGDRYQCPGHFRDRRLKRKTPRSEQACVGEAFQATSKQARVIVKKGGDYLLQIKDNQPTLAALAERAHPALPSFFH